MFLDSTPSGSDAFFITRSQLLPRDRDEQLDLYDARAGGGFERSIAEPCLGEACRGASPASPALPAPGTSSFAPAPGAAPGHRPHKHKKHRRHKRGGSR
jgi:hypothetical protein